MFKRFTVEDNISSTGQVKNSVQRQILSKIVEQFPSLADAIDQIFPKKSISIAKANDNIQLVIANNEVLFFNQKDGPFFPTLRLLHKYPNMMKRMQVDKGAIRFILGGANIMCPGFTSPGGQLPTDLVQAGEPVAIYGENKQHAMAVGITVLSSHDIASINKGIAVETAHFLADGLWHISSIS